MKPTGKIRHLALLTIFRCRKIFSGNCDLTKGITCFIGCAGFGTARLPNNVVKEYDSGSLKAAKQVHKLSLEYDNWRFGKLDPNKLKTDIESF